MTDPRKPPAGFWITVALVAVLVYPISFGPACWLASRTGIGINALPIVYGPIISRMNGAGSGETSRINALPPTRTLHFCPSGLVSRYATLLAAEGWCWRLFLESEDQPDLAVSLREGKWEWCEASER